MEGIYEETRAVGINFFRYCNENLSNTNEYNIARIIIEHIGDIKPFH